MSPINILLIIGFVLLAVYAVTKNRDNAMSSIRVSLSYLTTEEEVYEFLRVFDVCYNKLNMSDDNV